MNKRIICSLSCAFLLGCARIEYGRCPFLWIFLILEGYLVYSCITGDAKEKKKKHFLVFLSLVCFGAGMMICQHRQDRLQLYEQLFKEKSMCLVQGEIRQKEKKKDKNLVYLKNCILQLDHKNYKCNQILVYLTAEEYSIGETIIVKGNIKPFSAARNQGNYNEREYYQSLNIAGAVDAVQMIGSAGKPDVLRETLAQCRNLFAEGYQKCLSGADAGVMLAMILGDRSFMDPERKILYQKAGISHFYCISGLHISILGMALYGALRKRGTSYGISGILAGSWMVLYVMLTGSGISAVRAAGMFLILLYGKYRGRSYDLFTALSVMAAVLTGQNPGFLHHAGFLLSFGAVLGVAAANDRMREQEEDAAQKNLLKKIMRECKETVTVSVWIQLFTIPILCSIFYEIPVYGVCVNFFVLPCLGILLGMGLLGGVAGLFSVAAGNILLLPCHWLLKCFDTFCTCFLHLPNATLITGKFGMGKMMVWYGALMVLLGMGRTIRKAESLQQKSRMEKRALHRQSLFLWGGGMAIFLCLGLLLMVQPKRMFELDVLDVGQGDGIYFAMGDGTSVFIDGGSSSVSKVGNYRILPFLKYKGVRQMDYWFVSHCDSDHISGLTELLEADYKIRHLVVAKEMPEEEAWENLAHLAEKKGTKIIQMQQGDRLCGSPKNDRNAWKIRCLFPEKTNPTADRNGMSLTLLVETSEFLGFFGGDLAEEQEKILAETLRKDVKKVNVFKASHHGSKGSNCAALLEALKPEICVISCGEKNRYGHPHKEAVERMKDTGADIYKTMESGQILMRWEKKKYREKHFTIFCFLL